ISILPPEPDPVKESNQQIQSFLDSNLLRFILLIITAGFSSVLVWGSVSLGLDLYRHFFTDQRSAEILENPIQPVLVWVGITSVTLLFISVALYYVRELLGLSNGKKESSDSKPPPYIYLPPLPTPELSLFSTYESARFSDTFRKQEAGTVDTAILDLPLTIDATVQNAGLIKPVFQKYGTRSSYIFLIDETYTRNLATSWYTYLVEVLREENVSVTHFFYEEIPTTIWGEGRQKMPLESLNLEGRLLILGRSEGMVDHIDGGLFSWAEQILADFPEVGFLTPKSADQWGYYELTLAQYGIVAPANLEGLGSIVDVLNGRQDVEWWEWRDRIDIWDAEDPSPVSLQKDLSHEVFLWLCACAVYPQLEWKLVLKIGEALQETFADLSILLNPQAIGSLMSIRWFQTGKIPDRARAQLIEYLPEKQEHAVRALLQEIMDQATDVPPEGSLAAHNLQIFQLINQLQLAKDKDQKEALQKEIKELQVEFPVQEDDVLKDEVDKAIQNIPTVNWWSVAVDFFRSYLTRFAQNPEQSEIPLTGLIYTYSNRELENAAEALYPFFTLPYLKQVSEDYIPTYLQKFSPSSFVQLSGASESGERQEAISTFLRIFEKSETAQERRLEYLILGGTGMGKTTFLLNLFLAHLKRKQSREDALEIRFIPLRDPKIFDLIREVPQPRRTILLLDGLDEASGAVQNAQTYILRILEITQIFPIVIFSCRTQFFASEQDKLLKVWENTQSAQGISWNKLYLSPLTEKEIYAYIDKKYDLLEQGKRTKAQKIIEIAPDSMSRQMILGYLDEMIEEDLDEAKLIGLFHWIIQRWLGRQAARIPQDRQEQFKEGLWEFSIEATLEMYQNRRMFISSQEIEDLAARNQFGLSLHEMRTRSLLNCNKEGAFKFAHQSFFEYFLATAAATNRKIVGKFAPKEFPLAQKFYQEMIDEEIQATFADQKGEVESGRVNGPPKVFISYSWDSEEHKAWVLALANRLRQDGVDVILDQFSLSAGQNLRIFMEDSVKKADKIILILTDEYKRRADNREGYEYSLIYSKIDNESKTKFLLILRQGTPRSAVPVFLRSFVHVDMRDEVEPEQAYEFLLRSVYLKENAKDISEGMEQKVETPPISTDSIIIALADDPKSTPNFKKVLLGAIEDAAILNNGEVVVLHLFSNILSIEDSVAFKTLDGLVTNMDEFRQLIQDILEDIQTKTSSEVIKESEQVTQILSSKFLSRKIHGTIQLLLAILDDGNNDASRLLERYDIDYDRVRESMRRGSAKEENASSLTSKPAIKSEEASFDTIAQEIGDIRRTLIRKIDQKRLGIALERLEQIIFREFRSARERYSVEELKGRLSRLNESDHDYQMESNFIIRNTLEIIERLQEDYSTEFPYPRGPLEPYDPIVEQFFQQGGQVQFFYSWEAFDLNNVVRVFQREYLEEEKVHVVTLKPRLRPNAKIVQLSFLRELFAKLNQEPPKSIQDAYISDILASPFLRGFGYEDFVFIQVSIDEFDWDKELFLESVGYLYGSFFNVELPESAPRFFFIIKIDLGKEDRRLEREIEEVFSRLEEVNEIAFAMKSNAIDPFKRLSRPRLR
ncbi:MAG: TIR domain-containing protein, partial [Bacteroidota bacterium]